MKNSIWVIALTITLLFNSINSTFANTAVLIWNSAEWTATTVPFEGYKTVINKQGVKFSTDVACTLAITNSTSATQTYKYDGVSYTVPVGTSNRQVTSGTFHVIETSSNLTLTLQSNETLYNTIYVQPKYAYIDTDITNPISGILSGTVISETELELHATASTDNVAVTKVELLKDGQVIKTYNDGTAFTYIDRTGQVNHSYLYQLKVYDLAGNTQTSNTLILETTDRTVPVVGTVTGQVYSSTQINLSITKSTDNVAIIKVELLRNNEVIKTVLNGNAFTFEDINLLPTTLYTYVLRSTDEAGNIAESELVSLTTSDSAELPPGVSADGQYLGSLIDKQTKSTNERLGIIFSVTVGVLTGFIFALGFYWNWGRVS